MFVTVVVEVPLVLIVEVNEVVVTVVPVTDVVVTEVTVTPVVLGSEPSSDNTSTHIHALV